MSPAKFWPATAVFSCPTLGRSAPGASKFADPLLLSDSPSIFRKSGHRRALGRLHPLRPGRAGRLSDAPIRGSGGLGYAGLPQLPAFLPPAARGPRSGRRREIPLRHGRPGAVAFIPDQNHDRLCSAICPKRRRRITASPGRSRSDSGATPRRYSSWIQRRPS